MIFLGSATPRRFAFMRQVQEIDRGSDQRHIFCVFCILHLCCSGDGSVRQQRNTLTGVIDAGNVYAGSQEHFDDLIDSNSS